MVSLSAKHEALLKREFFYDDPEKIEGLMNDIKNEKEPPKLLYKYNVNAENRADRNKVHCSLCHGKRHWNGYVLGLSNGKKALVGRKCGRDHFKQAGFTIEENEFKREEEEQDYLKYFRKLENSLPNVSFILNKNLQDACFHQYDKIKLALLKGIPRFGQRLAVIPRENGQLLAYKKVRDPLAEKKRLEKEKPEWINDVEKASDEETRKRIKYRNEKWMEANPVTQKISNSVGMCQGFKILSGAITSPSMKIKECLDNIQNIINEYYNKEDTSSWTLSKMKKTSKEIQDTINPSIKEAFSLLHEMKKFSSQQNLYRLANWSQNCIDTPTVELIGNSLISKEFENQFIDFPTEFIIPQITLVETILSDIRSRF
jgi:hypothetical protein